MYGEMADDSESNLHRVCDQCVPELERTIPQEPTLAEVLGAIHRSPSQPIIDRIDATNSEYDDRFLIECPVCRTDLRQFGDEDLQAIHVASCLEGHATSPSFTGGSRHIVYKLPEGSPLIGTECVICFEEFEVLTFIVATYCRLAIGYPGRNVCVIFIGVVFVIGFVMAMVVLCISLDLRFCTELGISRIRSRIY
jgi:hypothetical protein